MKLTNHLNANGFQLKNVAVPDAITDAATKGYVDSKINAAQVVVDFGPEGDLAYITLNAGWITPDSIIVCSMAIVPTVDHDIEDYFLEELRAAAGMPSTGQVTIYCHAPNGTYGQYIINVIGV